jgi:hypothetical protein
MLVRRDRGSKRFINFHEKFNKTAKIFLKKCTDRTLKIEQRNITVAVRENNQKNINIFRPQQQEQQLLREYC